MTNSSVKKEAGWKYLLLSIGAFLGISLEAVHAFGWEPILYGGITFQEYATWQAVLHWVITYFTWAVAGYLLIRTAKYRLEFDIWAKGEKMRLWQLLAVLFGIILSATISYFSWDGFKAWK